MVITGMPAVRRLLVVLVALAVGVVGLTLSGVTVGAGRPAARRDAAGDCGPGARPETGIQGRVPLADYASGRASQGYRCNTKPLAHQGTTGGFKVLRYRDAQGNTCAFYDSTLLFPKDVLYNAAEGLGVVVLDMNNPKKPRKDSHPDLAGDAQPARVAARQREARPARRRCSATRSPTSASSTSTTSGPTASSPPCCPRPTPRCSATRAASPRTARPSTPPAPAGRRWRRST